MLHWQRKSVPNISMPNGQVTSLGLYLLSSGKRWKLYRQITKKIQVSLLISSQEERTWTWTCQKQETKLWPRKCTPTSHPVKAWTWGILEVHQRLRSYLQALHHQLRTNSFSLAFLVCDDGFYMPAWLGHNAQLVKHYSRFSCECGFWMRWTTKLVDFVYTNYPP